MGKYLAYLACTSIVMLRRGHAGVRRVGHAVAFPEDVSLLRALAVLALGLAAYGALFAFMGASLRRPLVSGLVFAFGWEQVALLVPGYLRRFTLAYHLEAVFRDSPPRPPACSGSSPSRPGVSCSLHGPWSTASTSSISSRCVNAGSSRRA